MNAATKGVNTPKTKSASFEQGLEPQTNLPEQFTELIRREVERNLKLAHAAGINKE